MSAQQRLFDGYAVEHEKGSISSFDIEDTDIGHYRADEVLVLVMTATVAGGSFKHTPGGEWVRTNKLCSHQVRVADGVMKDEIVEFFNLAGDELPFTHRKPASGGQGSGQAGGAPVGGPSTQVVAGDADASDSDDPDDDPDDEWEAKDAARSQVGQAGHDAALAEFFEEETG